MIGKLIKWVIRIIIILIIFAILPKSILEKVKQFFTSEIFFQTLKTGFYNLINFLKELGIDFEGFFEKIKNIFGLDLISLWLKLKKFLVNILLKLVEILS